MDTNTNPKSQTPNSNLSAGGQNANQMGTVPVVPSQQTKVQSQVQKQAQQPVGGSKEMPRVANEWVSPSTPEIVLPQEVKESGVTIEPLAPSVSQGAQQVGVSHAKEATPVKSVEIEPLGMNTPHPLLLQLKAAHKSVKDSLSWLVRLVMKEQDKGNV